MVVGSHSSAQTRIQQILRTTAQHFAIPSHLDSRAPIRYLIAREFKDPIRLRWTTSHPSQRVPGRCGISI